MSAPSVITIGNFDGVHVGHAALLARAVAVAGRGARGSSGGTTRRARAAADRGPASCRVVAVTFDPHPLTRLRPREAPARLTPFDDKAGLLRSHGADEVVRLRPDERTLGLGPEEFIRTLVDRFRPVAFVEGEDFRFGRERTGGIGTLAALGARLGFGVEVVPAVEVALSDQLVAPASSTLARWLIEHGRVRDAAIVLGRPYAMIGRVVRGDRRGRTIGFPTANLRSVCVTPADGVYAGVARLPGGQVRPAAISVGTKPTFGEGARAVEAYLLEVGAPRGPRDRGRKSHGPVSSLGLPEYGWVLVLEFAAWVRDQVPFESVGALVEQMKRDCLRVRDIVAAGEEIGRAVEVCGCR